MRRSLALLLALLALVPLTGCWDRREINDIVFISATAADKVDDLYKVTVQFPLPGQLGGLGSSGGGGGLSLSASRGEHCHECRDYGRSLCLRPPEPPLGPTLPGGPRRVLTGTLTACERCKPRAT